MRPTRTIQLTDRPPIIEAPRRPPAAFRPSDATEPARPIPSWDSLVEAVPELHRFEQEATEAAGNRFPEWLEHSGYLTGRVRRAADGLGVPFSVAMAVVMQRLATAYDQARRLRC